jgi:Ca-activated chloride channel family protein
MTAARVASENGLRIFSIGVGTSEGGFFPDITSNRREYKRDRSGQPVRSRLNEEMIQSLADAGSGSSFLLTDTDAVIEALDKEIAKVEKRDYEENSYTEYESHFSIFIIIALLLFMIEFFLSYRKNKMLAGKDLFGA